MQLTQSGAFGCDFEYPDTTRGQRQLDREFGGIDEGVRDPVGAAECGEIHAVWRAEYPLEDPRVLRVALLEQFECAAAVVVGYHDGQVGRARLTPADEQSGCVVQEGQIADQRDGASV